MTQSTSSNYSSSHHPSPYEEVNTVINLLLTEAQAVLGQHFVGLYLYGSLASGDFNPHSSDIDFLVVITEELPSELVDELRAMHHRLWASGLMWAAKLEGAYVSQRAIRRFDPDNPPCPTINEGKFYVDRQGSDWIIQRHIIREYGTALAGPDPKTLIDPVTPDEIRHSVQSVLNEWWWPMLDNPAWIRSIEYQAFAVLTMCRALYALHFGTIVSKPTAARWAQSIIDAQWSPLIEWAVQWKHGDTEDRLDEVVAFMRYAYDRVNQS